MTDALSTEVAAWIDDTWRDDLTLRDWWGALAEAGFAFPTWPEGLGGRGLSGSQARAISGELAARELIGPPTGNGPMMGAGTILVHGTEAQKHQHVRPVADGTASWCQLFSEPGAGSDLAGLSTRAERDGDVFRVTGQKVWNSSADTADFGMLIARTNLDVPKHAGITYFLIEMDQPGIEVRPLRQMNGRAEFCEVFLDGAIARVDDIIGDIDAGWTVARTTLGLERASAAASASRRLLNVVAGSRAGNLDRTVSDIADEARARRGKRSTGGELVLSSRFLIQLAKDHGVADDPVIRNRLAAYHAQSEVYRLTNQRAAAARAMGQQPGPEASIGKLALAQMGRRSTELGMAIIGAGGLLVGQDAASDGRAQFATLSCFAIGIGGGTNEIQRNVIAERSLGLPRDPDPSVDTAFRDLPTSAG